MPIRSASAFGRLALSLLSSVALAAACTGVSTIGSGDQPLGKSGRANANASGGSHAGDSAVGASAGSAGLTEASGGGAGVSSPGGDSNGPAAAGAGASAGG